MPRPRQPRQKSGPGDLVVTRRCGAATVLVVAGELDVATAPGLHRQLTTELRRSSTPLVVDLTPLVFLGVAGARVLADAVRLAGRTGVPIALAGLSPLARCAALSVGLPVFEVCHRTAADALQRLAPPGARSA